MKVAADSFRLTGLARTRPALARSRWKIEKFRLRGEPYPARDVLTPQRGRPEPVGGIGIDGWLADAGRGKDGRWASNFSHGDRVAARIYGFRCWSTPWRRFPVRNGARFPVIGWSWLLCMLSLRDRRGCTRHTPLISACGTELRPLSPLYSPAICSRGRVPRSTPRSLASSRSM